MKTFIILLITAITVAVAQQNLISPRVSPPARVMQGIGFASVTFSYSSPSVKGRQVWGGLVPYADKDDARPWRAGANENTTITFSHPARVEGREIPAGTYGLHMIIRPEKATVIFSRDNKAWGSYSYTPRHDQLRVEVKMETAPFTENLTYGFKNTGPESTTAYLRWAEKEIPFTISFDSDEITYENYREQLTGTAGFSASSWGRAAEFCLDKNIHLDQGRKWIERALKLRGGATFTHMMIKAGYLEKEGRAAEAGEWREKAMNAATESDLNKYGQKLLRAGKTGESLKILKRSLEKFPQSWKTHSLYAAALKKTGNNGEAARYYKKALELAPRSEKPALENLLKSL